MSTILFTRAQQQSMLGMFLPLVLLVLIIVVFYFFLIRPQMKRKKETQKFRNAQQKGDKVVTSDVIDGKVDEITKLKTLLDQGAITQDEFESLKKNILNAPSENRSSHSNSEKISSGGIGNQQRIQIQANSSRGNENINYLALICAGITAISVFLPWVAVASSASWGGQHVDLSSGGISGISVGGGIFGIIMAIAGGILAYSNKKWASIFGAINFINGVGYAVGWFGINGSSTFSSSFGGGHMEAGVKPQFGLFIFIITSFLFIIFSLTHKSKNHDIVTSNANSAYSGNTNVRVRDTTRSEPSIGLVLVAIIVIWMGIVYFFEKFLK